MGYALPGSSTSTGTWDKLFSSGQIFRNQTGEAYADTMDVDGTRKILPIDGRQFGNLLTRMHCMRFGRMPAKKEISELRFQINAWADISPRRFMHLRTAQHDGRIYYSLGDDLGSIVEIRPGAWSVGRTENVYFANRPLGGQQVLPTPTSGDSDLRRRLFQFVNLINPDDQLLFLANLATCIVPESAHPACLLVGGEGSAKSSTARIVKALIDPANIDLLGFPEKDTDLAQICSHNHMAVFDNLARMSRTQSDVLCRAVTGGAMSKRRLYSDADDFNFTFQCCVVLTSINLVAEQPDLLDRALLFRMPIISPDTRQCESIYWQEFQKTRPLLLGWIFDILAKAMEILPTVKVENLPRLADFYRWGIAISGALGESDSAFLTAFGQNRQKINEALLDANSLASTLVDFMSSQAKWEGTATELLNELIKLSGAKTLPKAANQLSRQLKEIETTLGKSGIGLQWGRYSDRNVAKITLVR